MPASTRRFLASPCLGAAILGALLSPSAWAEVHVRPSSLVIDAAWGPPTEIDIDEDGIVDIAGAAGMGALGRYSLDPGIGARFADLDPSSGFYGQPGQLFAPADWLPFPLWGIPLWQASWPLIPPGRQYFPLLLVRDGAPHAAWLMADAVWYLICGPFGCESGTFLRLDVRQIAWDDEPWKPIEIGWSDCDQDGQCDRLQTAANPEIDCDGNGLPDQCDLAAGGDCDGDGMLDGCAIASGVVSDCNANGVPDSCEIASGEVHDCDADGVPDECQGGASPMEGAISLALLDFQTQASVPHFGLVMPSEEITIEFWQKVDAPQMQTTFRLDWSETNRCMAHVPWTDGRVYWDFGDPSPIGRLEYEPPEPIVGSWQHFALQASKAGGFMRIYRNGVLEASKSSSDTYLPLDQPLLLGGTFYNPGAGFSGGLDEFRVWDHIRSPEEIKAHLATGVDPRSPGLVAYWRMDEGAGSVVHDLAAGRDATIDGPVSWLTAPPACPPSADLDRDGSVGATDLAILIGAWGGPCRGCEADLDRSGAVDAADLAILLAAWS